MSRVKQITYWGTTDGTLFLGLEAAHAHQDNIDGGRLAEQGAEIERLQDKCELLDRQLAQCINRKAEKSDA